MRPIVSHEQFCGEQKMGQIFPVALQGVKAARLGALADDEKGPLVGTIHICAEQNVDALFALLASVALFPLEVERLCRQHFVEESGLVRIIYVRHRVLFHDVSGVGRNPQ